MRLIANALNGQYFANLVRNADVPALTRIRLAVAYAQSMDPLFELAAKRKVPLALYALMDGEFPSIAILRKFVELSPPSWQLFLTRRFYHPKIYWFEGVGAYIGSANLTNNGWTGNLECGVWFTASELADEGYDDQLAAMFDVIEARSVAASPQHLAIARRLAESRKDLIDAQKAYDAEVDTALKNLPGQTAATQVGKTDEPGGAARRAFVSEWQSTHTILKKLTAMVAGKPQPSWLDASVHPAVVQDQVTEYWYHRTVRSTGESYEEIERLHRANEKRTEAAVAEMFALWPESSDKDQWTEWTNETPARLRTLLARESLAALDLEKLTEIVWGAHAARECARQVENSRVGLQPGQYYSKPERCEAFARALLARKPGEKTVGEVFEYVLWGDKRRSDCAERIWDACHVPEWRLPFVGVSIWGELLGYARPDDFPPRNNRVSKTLRALGFKGVAVR